MKLKTNLIVAAGFLISFVAGLIVGLALTNPGMSVIEAAGTIGKVDKYRNVRVTEQDVELRNDLLADTSLKEAYKNYLLFEYTANIKMADNIQFAIEAASQAAGFRAAHAQTLGKLEEYAYFLDNARLQLLEAIATLNDLTEKSNIAIRTVMNNAGNALAQTTYRSNVLFDFIFAVEGFFDSVDKETHPELALAHDLLFANLFIASIVNENTAAMQSLSGKELFTENESLALKEGMIQNIVALDAERLRTGFTDQESLLNAILNSEQLNTIYLTDQILALQFAASEQLNNIGFFDIETLQVYLDTEQLGFYSHGELLEFFGPLGNADMLHDLMQSREDMLGSIHLW